MYTIFCIPWYQEGDLYETAYPTYQEEGMEDDEEDEEPLPRLYVGDVKENITTDMLRNLFKPFGDVVEVWLPKPPKTGL